jgi:methyl-accepting chemotaxis protein
MTTMTEEGSVAQQASPIDAVGAARAIAMGLALPPPLAAFAAGNSVIMALVGALILAGIAFATRGLESKTQPLVLAVVLIGQCIALTAAFAGHSWQIDSHMMYFAVLAIVATMGSIPALLLAVVVTAVDHLALGILMPGLVYPEADLVQNLLRTTFHAAIVVFEAAVLTWTLLQGAKTAKQIDAGRAALAHAADDAAQSRNAAEAARAQAVAAAQTTREEGQRAAAAVEEITASASATAESAAHAQKVVGRAAQDADGSSQVVERAMAAMNAIEDSSSQIGRIVGVIDEIARQTDLLALNAAVESARAGEAGRGFAVVANEVRTLAKRSADATQQIRGLVVQSSHRVSEGVGLVGETREALTRIVTAIADLNDLVGNIASSTAEQSAGLSQVNMAITRIDTIVEWDQDKDTEGDQDQYRPIQLASRRRRA